MLELIMIMFQILFAFVRDFWWISIIFIGLIILCIYIIRRDKETRDSPK